MQGTPRILATRALNGLQALRRWTPPGGRAAVFRLIWNQWPTARRFQRRNSSGNHCVLGCPGLAEDSIEHYCRCHIVRSFARRRRLGLVFNDGYALPSWTMTPSSDYGTEDRKSKGIRTALCVYAVYGATNAARQTGGVEESVAHGLLAQHVKCKGRHSWACGCIQNSGRVLAKIAR